MMVIMMMDVGMGAMDTTNITLIDVMIIAVASIVLTFVVHQGRASTRK